MRAAPCPFALPESWWEGDLGKTFCPATRTFWTKRPATFCKFLWGDRQRQSTRVSLLCSPTCNSLGVSKNESRRYATRECLWSGFRTLHAVACATKKWGCKGERGGGGGGSKYIFYLFPFQSDSNTVMYTEGETERHQVYSSRDPPGDSPSSLSLTPAAQRGASVVLCSIPHSSRSRAYHPTCHLGPRAPRTPRPARPPGRPASHTRLSPRRAARCR